MGKSIVSDVRCATPLASVRKTVALNFNAATLTSGVVMNLPVLKTPQVGFHETTSFNNTSRKWT